MNYEEYLIEKAKIEKEISVLKEKIKILKPDFNIFIPIYLEAIKNEKVKISYGDFHTLIFMKSGKDFDRMCGIERTFYDEKIKLNDLFEYNSGWLYSEHLVSLKDIIKIFGFQYENIEISNIDKMNDMKRIIDSLNLEFM